MRLSKVYGVEKGDGTLLDEMACALSAGRVVRAASDQLFCPTSVADLVRAIHALQGSGLKGVVNLCSPESWSRHRIACAVAEAMAVDGDLVEEISLHEIPAMQHRPLNTTMSCSRVNGEGIACVTPLRNSNRSRIG